MLSDEYCPIHVSWNVLSPHRRNDITKIHWCYTRAVWRRKKLYALTSAVAWPLRAAVFAWKRTRQYGPDVKQRAGVTMIRQFLDQLYLAARYFIPPRSYYFYSLYDSAKRNLASEYIHQHEIIELLQFLNAYKDSNVLHDKRRFFTECKRLGLPTIPIIAEFENGRMKVWRDGTNKKLPKVDLFAKPALGVCGQGVKRWIYEGSDRYCSLDGTLLIQDQLLNYLSDSSKEKPYILQKRLFNHPYISGLSKGGLCTLRVLVCRPPNGPSEHIASVFKMPIGKSLADNFRSGGIASPVNESDGTLGSAIGKDPAASKYNIHPDTGNKIVGFRIPYWTQIIQLCLQAHEVFSAFSSVGWDVAVTEDGPVLVEGNPDYGVEMIQGAHNWPLGKTRFAEIFILHMEKQKNPKSANTL